ncbi:MAG: XRE family transcriptional regulator, partial [Treponema sp.]|nr:XRE family transcriptional regulator [Treponema sp.]
VSKWETGRGFPDIVFLEPLAQVLKVSIIELLSGKEVVNQNKNAKIQRSKFYVCPICGNVVFSVGEALISCCGIQLPALECENLGENPENPEDGELAKSHEIKVENSDGELFVSLNHPMEKSHYISWIACVGFNFVNIVKLYPEQNPEARFPFKKDCSFFAYCNHHGLFQVKV